VSDRIPAGTVGQTLKPGSVARIFTGAPVPEGADAVIMQEVTELVGEEVRFNEVARPGQNIRQSGQDIRKGTTILSKGRNLRSQDIGLLASVGCGQVEVFKKLKIAVMSTGDELIEPGTALKPGQIYNSNHPTLQAMILQLGMEPVDLGLVEDSKEATEQALLRGAEISDCIISSGGVSVGEEDYVKGAVEKLGNLDLWRIAMKPGKPLAFGYVRGTPFFGLPGNPVSSFVTFMLIARPYLLKSQGSEALELVSIHGVTDFDMKPGSRREYLRVRTAQDDTGQVIVSNFSDQGSGVLSSVSWADGLAEIEIGREIRKGDKVRVILLP